MFRIIIIPLAFLLALAQAATSATIDDEYDFIVVGSGAGGGPLACRLAEANFKTLLIEAGNDQGTNVNTSIPAFQGVVAQDPKIRWDVSVPQIITVTTRAVADNTPSQIYVSHYTNLSRAQRDPKFVYALPNGSEYVGLQPPPDAEPKGILYPRAGVLGGCVSHNALTWILPHRSDWDHIANITGDSSWSASAMEQYTEKVYEWLHVEATHPTIVLQDLALAQQLVAGAAVAGRGIGVDPLDAMLGLGQLLVEDPNDYRDPRRDAAEGFYQIPMIMRDGKRRSVSVVVRVLWSFLALFLWRLLTVMERSESAF